MSIMWKTPRHLTRTWFIFPYFSNEVNEKEKRTSFKKATTPRAGFYRIITRDCVFVLQKATFIFVQHHSIKGLGKQQNSMYLKVNFVLSSKEKRIDITSFDLLVLLFSLLPHPVLQFWSFFALALSVQPWETQTSLSAREEFFVIFPIVSIGLKGTFVLHTIDIAEKFSYRPNSNVSWPLP